MSTLTGLQEAMAAFLENQGVRALSAWPREGRKRYDVPLAVVSVKQVEGEAAGFGGYLGQVYDSATRTWREACGQRVNVLFALALYSPETAGEEGCRVLLDQVVEAMQRERPGGLTVEKWTMGETAFQQASGMFCGQLQLRCRGLLMAKEEDTGAFLGFEVNGGIIIDSDNNPCTAGGLLGVCGLGRGAGQRAARDSGGGGPE